MENQAVFSIWLRLLYAGVSAKTVLAVLKAKHDLLTLLTLTKQHCLSFGFTLNQHERFHHMDKALIERCLQWFDQHPNCHVLTFLDADYPPLLLEINRPPILLFVKGDVAVLKQPQLAMVGSRQASPQGKQLAFEFAKAFAQNGLVITSGLALGIDAASHRGALAGGQTIAVLGTGLAHLYPRQHRQLSADIQTAGAIVSEFLPFVGPERLHFPKRNRIISGLSLGVLVVEATLRSGSLITAEFALEQGREVFAVPGSIYNGMARGCHALIRQGAKIVDSIQLVTEELSIIASNHMAINTQISAPNLDKTHQDLLACVGDSPTSVEEIVKKSQLTGKQVCAMLLSLEAEGVISRLAGGYQRVGK